MLTVYFRSSSMNQWVMCQMKYFLIYILGHKDKTNKKADMGTAVHGVCEILAIIKKYIQEHPLEEDFVVEHDHMGKVEVNKNDLYRVTYLSDADVDKINKSRKNKSIYCDQNNCYLEYGHKRFGNEYVNRLIKKAYDFYVESNHDTQPSDFKCVYNWTWMALESQNKRYDPRFCDILEPEQQFDVQLDEDWAKYDFMLDGEKLSGYLSLKGTIDLIRIHDEDTIEIVDYKGLPVETPIPTPDGWNTMGDLQVGDEVFDEDGKITKVTGKSNKKIKPCYKIHFDDKTTVVCDNEHLWKKTNGEVVNILELKPRDKIAVAKPLQTEELDLPIDPYVLGYWLGNGRNRDGEICTPHQFILDEISCRGYKLGNNISSTDCGSYTVYGLVTELRKLHLLRNKHIPSIYLRASYQQRLDLLRGLMDSGGSANPLRKQGVFTNCTQRLSEDLYELCLTLGQKPNLCKTKQTGFGKTVDAYPVHFRPIGINPFILPEKAERIDPEWGPGNSDRRLIKKIEYVGEKETQCIMVDSPSSTYLCTKNMIPTHNTGQRKNWSTGKRKELDCLMEDTQLMLYYLASRLLYPQYKNIIITINFIRDGGTFTLPFDDSILPTAKQRIKDLFEEVVRTEYPTLRDPTFKDFMCNKLCAFYTKRVDGEPYCKYIEDQIYQIGLDNVMEAERVPGFSPSYYSAPGDNT